MNPTLIEPKMIIETLLRTIGVEELSRHLKQAGIPPKTFYCPHRVWAHVENLIQVPNELFQYIITGTHPTANEILIMGQTDGQLQVSCLGPREITR